MRYVSEEQRSAHGAFIRQQLADFDAPKPVARGGETLGSWCVWVIATLAGVALVFLGCVL